MWHLPCPFCGKSAKSMACPFCHGHLSRARTRGQTPLPRVPWPRAPGDRGGRVGPNAFMVQAAGGMAGNQVNVEVQLIADHATEWRSYDSEIAIASLEGAEEIDAAF